MASVYNQKLKSIASKTAVVRSSIPVIVCDTNLRVCQMSHGALHRFPSMRIGTDFSVYLPKETTLCDGAYITLLIGKTVYPTLIAADCADTEAYTAFIFESSYIEFTANPEYVCGARIALVGILKELMKGTQNADHKLTRRFSQLEHLKSCAMLADLYYLNRTTMNIEASIDHILKQCEEPLETVGCSAVKNINTAAFSSFVCNRQYFNTMMPMLMAAGVVVSKNGRLEIFCREHNHPSAIKAVEFGITTKCSDDCTHEIHDLHELIEHEPPVALELSAVSCMLDAIGKQLEFSCEGDMARLYFVIEAGSSEIIELHNNFFDSSDAVRRLFTELCKILGLI